jgi:2-keto-4-pentenoate hydratase/2-oxohepta-3-ene-1,7-dioic acid hydratase in catechol pathway
MQLVTFERDGAHHLGALTQRDGRDLVVDLNQAAPGLPRDMIAFLAGGDANRALAAQALANPPAAAVLDRSSVKLAAPIPRPGKIICIGLNYRDHAAESNAELPAFPTVFAKYSSCIIGPGASIVIPRVTSQVDYEGELAVVIGRRARDVAEADALDYVAGYAPFNDVSARDYQMRTSQWTIGKTFDTFGPIGPALVTADEIPDPHALDIRVSIGDDVLQSSNTKHLIFTIPQLIAYLTSVMTLEPGDVIATGTPAGVGAARKPQRWLVPGDLVRVEISGLGALENPVAASA